MHTSRATLARRRSRMQKRQPPASVRQTSATSMVFRSGVNMLKHLLQFSNWLEHAGPAESCNRLAEPVGAASTPRPAKGLILLLLVVCFVPRAVTAWRLDGICPDATSYIQMGQSLEQGDFNRAFSLQLNIFPALLAGLHQLGLPWEIGGRIWGMIASTLVVLPLFGWVRRQFNDRLAVIACLLYAAHPELIEWSSEIVRDPTFWLLFTTGLYLCWRAAAEISLRHYAAAGLAMALAASTRFEGLFLIVPLVGWSVVRARAIQGYRWRLARGTALAMAILPALLVVANLAWSNRIGRVEIIRLEKLVLAKQWVEAWWRPPKVAVPVPVMARAGVHNREAQPGGAVHWGPKKMVWHFVHQGERGLTPLFGILLIVGCLARPRLILRGDQWPMALLALVICGGIWVHIWFYHLSSSRYFLSVAILSSPTAAAGWIHLSALARRVMAACRLPRGAWRWAPAAILYGLLVIGWADALTTNVELRRLDVRMGEWIARRFGRQPTILGVGDQLPVVAHFAHGNFVSLPVGLPGGELIELVRSRRPDVVVFSRRHLASECDVLMHAREQLGLETAESPADLASRFVVLARRGVQR